MRKLTRPPTATSPGEEFEVLETHVLLVEGREAHVFVELEQNANAPHELSIDTWGSACGNANTTIREGVSFELNDAGAIRALGEALVELANRAEARGMLKPLRAKQGA